MRKLLVFAIVFLTICSFYGAAYGEQTSPAYIFFKIAPTGITGDQQNLYLMAAGKILEYKLSDLTLALSVDLPDPGQPPQNSFHPKAPGGNFQPPPPPPPHGLWASNGSLYVLIGPNVYVYSIPDLTLEKTIELPKPDLPQTGK